MTSGLADYYWDSRPRYGTALLETGSLRVIANTRNHLAGADGKGMTYGGVVWLDHTSSQANGILQMQTDDKILNDLSLLRLNDYSMLKPRTLPVSLNKYDPVNFIYSVGISYGITFEKSIEISYIEDNGTRPTIHYRLFYTLI